jgi:hypothetical protein
LDLCEVVVDLLFESFLIGFGCVLCASKIGLLLVELLFELCNLSLEFFEFGGVLGFSNGEIVFKNFYLSLKLADGVFFEKQLIFNFGNSFQKVFFLIFIFGFFLFEFINLFKKFSILLD